jgi:hypothetical protein
MEVADFHHLLHYYLTITEYYYYYYYGVGKAQSVKHQAAGWMVWVQFLARARDFSLLHSVQTGSGAHPASYQMDSRASFSGGSATRV